jgi:hypothetical protein
MILIYKKMLLIQDHLLPPVGMTSAMKVCKTKVQEDKKPKDQENQIWIVHLFHRLL